MRVRSNSGAAVSSSGGAPLRCASASAQRARSPAQPSPAPPATAAPEFERTLIRVALKHTGGHRQDAAKLLGWGRNTLTRKLKELGMEEGDADDPASAAPNDAAA
jgi:two-component system nitrogen regulation response regulator GlnG